MQDFDCHACREYNELTRRQFLGVTGSAALAAGVSGWLPRVVLAQDFCSDRDIIVSIFLRGAADGLTLCVPHVEDAYYAARREIAIPRPDSGDPFAAIDLDGFFGFPPQFAPLLEAFQAGHLLMVHASGSTDPSRSHFDAQRFMEVGKPADASLFTGWLGRHLATVPPLTGNPILRAVGIGYGLQRSLQGGPQSIPVPDLDNFGLSGAVSTIAARRDVIEDMYALVEDPVKAAAQTTTATIDLLNTINFVGYTPAGGAVYPTGGFGYAMKSTAALIKADVGVEAVAIDVGGWDTHNNQGSTQGTMATLMTTLAGGLAAFHSDMFAANGRNVVVVIQSEFGRQLNQNGSLGCDHGHGNVMILLGNHIAGGRVLTNWPGLAPNQLFQGRDLQVTIDFRDVLAEIVQYRLGNPNLAVVFPDYVPTIRGVTATCAPPGDMNCDGLTDAADAGAFAQALTNPQAYAAQHPGCDLAGADLSGDGLVNGADVGPFMQAVVSH